MLNLSVFAPTIERCGIAQHACLLNNRLRDHFDITVVPSQLATSGDDFACLGANMNHGDIAHVHYEHGFFTAGEQLEQNTTRFFQQIEVPMVISFHCLPFLDIAGWEDRIRQKNVLSIVHNSSHFSELNRMVPAGNLSVVHLPAKDVWVRPDVSRLVQEKHGLSNRRVITISGFIKSHKGYELVIECLKYLPPDVILLIAGGAQNESDRNCEQQLRNVAESCSVSDRVVITGYLEADHLEALIASSHLVLAPFKSMTASASIAAAYSAARPIVASDLPQNRELSEKYGGMLLFESGCKEDLLRKLKQLLSDRSLVKHLEKQTENYRNGCSVDDTCDRVLAALSKVVSR